MSDNLAQPAGSISIIKCDIVSHTGKRIDFRGLVKEFSIFDSIQKSFVTATFLLIDAVSLITVLPIIGQETIELEFRTPHDAFDKSIAMKLRVIGVESFSRLNSRTSQYLLQCATPEFVKDTTTAIKKSYGDIPITDMMKKVFDEFLAVESELTISESSEGMRTLVIPNMAPSQAMKFLCKEAKSTNYNPSNYVFWQSFEGFNVKTIEELIDKKPQHKDRYYTTDFNTFDDSKSAVDLTLEEIGAAGGSRDTAEAISKNVSKKPFEFMKMEAFEFINFTQYAKVTRLGGLESEVHIIDPITSSHTVKGYNYFTDYDKFKRTSGYSSQKNATGQTDDITQTSSEKNYFLPRETDLINPTAIRKNFVMLGNKTQQNGYEPDQKEDFILEDIASKAMLENLLVSVTVPGDSTRRAGDLLNLEFPEYGGTDDVMGSLNKFVSGEFLVVGTRHIYTATGYKTAMMCVKNVFATNFQNVEGPDNGL